MRFDWATICVIKWSESDVGYFRNDDMQEVSDVSIEI